MEPERTRFGRSWSDCDCYACTRRRDLYATFGDGVARDGTPPPAEVHPRDLPDGDGGFGVIVYDQITPTDPGPSAPNGAILYDRSTKTYLLRQEDRWVEMSPDQARTLQDSVRRDLPDGVDHVR